MKILIEPKVKWHIKLNRKGLSRNGNSIELRVIGREDISSLDRTLSLYRTESLRPPRHSVTAAVLRSEIKDTPCTLCFKMLNINKATLVEYLSVILQQCKRVAFPRTLSDVDRSLIVGGPVELCSPCQYDKHRHSVLCHVTMVLWREWPGVTSGSALNFRDLTPWRIMKEREG